MYDPLETLSIPRRQYVDEVFQVNDIIYCYPAPGVHAALHPDGSYQELNWVTKENALTPKEFLEAISN